MKKRNVGMVKMKGCINVITHAPSWKVHARLLVPLFITHVNHWCAFAVRVSVVIVCLYISVCSCFSEGTVLCLNCIGL